MSEPIMKLTPTQISAIAAEVVLQMKARDPEPEVVTPDPVEVVTLDETVTAANKKEAQLIAELPTGVVAYKSKSRTEVVNHTQESMNFLSDWYRNKKTWRTRTSIR